MARHHVVNALLLLAVVLPRPASAPAAAPKLAPASCDQRTIAPALDSYAATFVRSGDDGQSFDFRGRDLALRFERAGVRLGTTGGVARAAFLAADASRAPRPVDPVPGATSIFEGPKERWQAGLTRYRSLRYDGLWPGIDLAYRAGGTRIKYDFTVHPGADVRAIAIRYTGAESVRVDDSGGLVVRVGGCDVLDEAPYAYQVRGALEVAVACRYAVCPTDAGAVVAFDVGAYDPTLPLVVYPSMIVYAGFLGGSNEDAIAAVAVDAAGDAYVVGATASPTTKGFPAADGFDTTFNPLQFCDTGFSTYDAFVAKVKADGSGLDFCTYLGGKCNQAATGVALDSTGNVYVVGATTSDQSSFPVTVGPRLTYGGGRVPGDGFVAKLSADGTHLVYCGYLGGERPDLATAVAVDAAGSAYVVGTTSSKTSFPLVVGPMLTTSDTSGSDGFVAKV